MTLKLRVKEVAEANGITDVVSLAARAGIAYATAHRLWKGNVGHEERGIGILVLYKVARALNVRMSELYEEEPLGQLTGAPALG